MMRTLTCSAIAFVLAAASTIVQAESKFDAAARARAIAPLVEEDTTIVVHIDLSRVPPQPMFDFLGDMRLVAPLEMCRQANGLQQTGVKDVYLIATAGIFSDRQPQMLVAAPVSSGGQESALRAALRLRAKEGRMIGNVLVIGRPGPIAFRPVERPELAAAFAAVGDTAAQAILIPPADTQRVVDELWPQLPQELGGGPSSVLTRGIRWAAVGIDVSPHKSLRLVVKAADARAAEALHGKLVELLHLAGQWEKVRKHVPEFETVAALLTPRVEGDRLTVVSDEKTETFENAMATLVRPLLEAEAQAATMNNLRVIAVGMHNYHFANKHFPLPASHTPDGKPLLSWRVHLLPYLDQSSLFKQFHLDEPWDSPHNRTLIDRMPSVYRLPLSKTEYGRTNYLLPVGNGAMFDADKPIAFKDIRDGTSNTLMVVEADDQHAVVWTKPGDWPFDPKDPAKGLGRFFRGGFMTAVADGSVRWSGWPQSPKDIARLRARFTRAGSETISW